MRFALLISAAVSLCAQTSTTTNLSSTSNPVSLGATVVLTATVSPTATGTVMFLDGFDIVGTAVLNGNSAAELPVRFPVARIHRIRAVYTGDSTRLSSSSTPLVLPVIGTQARSFPTTIILPAGGLFVDVNRDGTLDIVGDDGKVYLADGDGSYSSAITSISARPACVTDFNNDGKPDLLTTDGRLALGNGNGTWVHHR